ncbi:type II secretion system F family protein, partial [Burkholderia pseudomallei]
MAVPARPIEVTTMDPSRLGAIALVLGAIGVLMLAALAIMQAVLARRTGRTLADA